MHKELKIYGNVAERFSKRFLAIKLLEKDVEITLNRFVNIV